MKPILVVGDANVDLSVRLPAQSGNRRQPPPPDLRLGGTAANTAIAVRHLGVPSALLGMVGDDGYGRFARRELAAAGVDVTHLLAHPEAFTALVLAIVDSHGERTLFGWPRRGAAHTQLAPRHVEPHLITRVSWLHTTGMCMVESPTRDAILHAMALAREAHVPVSFDLNLRIGFENGVLEAGFLETIQRAMALSDVVLGSAADELSHLGERWDEVARRLAQDRTVVARLGAEGAQAFFRGGVVAAPAFPAHVVSTLGAGDAFNAGFIVAMAEGRGLAEALRCGNAVAALKISGQDISRSAVAACV